ncbi:hypothetical protein Patl1_29370 [Pistacia atlantica]|uniref:Uncharacterized protein n=1 Tax=Pistacia atlantica TaxID=434234 RepID=A0ACC1AB51_9ROSI|nr:hypothetical protein Patl1_29370 [Pistacia atlantica]
MRIRKNIKLSSILPSKMLQTYVCQLNQSPWDVISDTSFSFNHRLEEEDTLTDDKRFIDETDDVKGSATSLTEIQEKIAPNEEENNEKNQSIANIEEEEEIYSKRDQSNGGGNELEQSYNAKPNASTNGFVIGKSELATRKTATKAVRRGRPRAIKTANIASTFSRFTEFYYYSGFGPFRGKKRGEVGGETSKAVTNCTQNKSSCSEIDCVKVVYELDADDENGKLRKVEVIDAEKNGKTKKKRFGNAKSLPSL